MNGGQSSFLLVGWCPRNHYEFKKHNTSSDNCYGLKSHVYQPYTSWDVKNPTVKSERLEEKSIHNFDELSEFVKDLVRFGFIAYILLRAT